MWDVFFVFQEMAKSIKMQLDAEYGRMWHVFMIRGEYRMYYSHESGNSISLKKGDRIYIIFKTPSWTLLQLIWNWLVN